MSTNIYRNENPNVGFNRLSVANPFNYYSSNNYAFVPSKYSTLTVKTPKLQYIIEENKIGLKTNPNPKPMTNAFNLNTANIINEQKFNPYYNQNNYPQRVDNVKDLMNYTYSERVPRYTSKTNPVITRFAPIPGNTIIYQNMPYATRIPQTNENIYNTLINNNRNLKNYATPLDNTYIQQLINNNNEHIKNKNYLENQYTKKVQQINDTFLATDIKIKNNQQNIINYNNQNIKNNVVTKISPEYPIFQHNPKNIQGIGNLTEIISNSNSKGFHRISNRGLVKSYGYYEDSNHENRAHMEDQGISIENLNGDSNKILFCLFDGHGGGEVSKFLQENFAIYFKKMLPFRNYFGEITQLFKILDEKIRLLNMPKVGSTATIVYIERQNGKRTLYCANVGDTRCVLVTRNGVMRLSYDDIVDDPNERARVIKQGGQIFNGRVMGELILSRSFGDWDMKNYGVIVEPHITKVDITDDVLFIFKRA